MSASDVLVLGGAGAGKTHYAGQLLGRFRHDRQGRLRLRIGGADDLGKLEEVLSCLEEGRAAGHTPAKTWTGIKCQLETQDGANVLLEWPEYAGERLFSIVDDRLMTSEWRKSANAAQAWMLFIRLSTLHLHEDLLSRPTGLPPEPSTSEMKDVNRKEWDDRARYVEMLQMLLFSAGRSTYNKLSLPRLAVVLSCWDELEDEGTPDQVFAKRLPLLHAFVRSTWVDDAWSIWALTSLGRALQPDKRDEEFASQGPENFGFVISPGRTERDSDLTAPVAWLLDV